jgi:hypothetical protein
MEHMMEWEELDRISDEIPLIPWFGFDHDTTRAYDIVPFEQYPIVRGWAPEILHAFHTGEAIVDEPFPALQMIQSWIFFGFLESAFRPLHLRFSTTDFVEMLPAGPVLKTHCLRSLYHTYLELGRRVKEGDLDLDEEIDFDGVMVAPSTLASSLVSSMEHFESTCMSFSEKSAGSLPMAPMFKTKEFDIIARLAVLVGDTVNFMRSFLLSCPTRNMSFIGTNANKVGLLSRLMEKGWCPALFDLFIFYSDVFAEYACLFEPTDPMRERHQHCRAGEKCIAVKIDTSRMTTKHVRDGCGCPFVWPPLHDVLQILGRGGIPLVDLTTFTMPTTVEAIEQNTLAAIESSGGLDYVTFSHVWADGLGSDTERGLPACQVLALRDHAFMAGSTYLVWIDALCIPSEPVHRNIAIEQMSSVYGHSAATIILDAGLQSKDLPEVTSSHSELCLRIATSIWNHRLWTMQECVLPRKNYIVFKNGICSMDDVAKNHSEYTSLIASRASLSIFHLLYPETRQVPVHLGSLHSWAARRDCSRPSDEALALAPLLDLPVSPLTVLKDEERMAKFWLLVGRVPKDVIFVELKACDRLAKLGFLWAPKSFMSIAAETMHGPLDALVTEQGLQANCFVYSFGGKGLFRKWPFACMNPDAEYHTLAWIEKGTRREGQTFQCDAIACLTDPEESVQRTTSGVALVAVSEKDAPPLYRYECQVIMTACPAEWVKGRSIDVYTYESCWMDIVIA